MDEKPTCKTCVYLTRPGFPGEATGTCVRFPQVALKHEIDWCGEHTPKNAEVQIRETKKGG